ncbi:MAG TPA: D-alanyl-D-alanine carboxypeptidase, partial [Blastocatellia bacterium]
MANRIVTRRSFILLLALVQALAGASAQVSHEPKPAPQAETLDSLRARILTHISQTRFAPAAWGVKVESLDSGKVIFEHNAQKYFSPASNAKLYTAALALDRLGLDYRIKTSLYARSRPDAAGALKGDLIIYGRGDPLI